jgi:superfamily II DNA or RNA helicase
LSELRGRLAAKDVRFTDTLHPPALESAWSLPELRWYQRASVSAWRDSGDRGVIVLPTGAGKTVVALAAIAELGVATLVLVPTRVLLDQWARALAKVWPHPIGRLGDGDHSVAPITVSTYASATTWAPRIGDRFGLVVVDEAHHVGAGCPGEILEMLIAPARLGLTATPPAGPSEWALARQIGPTVYSLGIEALRGTDLADFDHVLVTVQLDTEERALYQRLRGEFSAFYAQQQRSLPGIGWRDFLTTSQRSLVGRDALAAWRGSRALLAYPAAKRAALRSLLENHAGDRVLLFTADNATAYAIARELLVVPITCDIGRTERAEMLDRFRTGECSVLVSSQVLDEGFDVPDAEVAIVVGGTASQRRHAQRIGRVLRPRPDKRAAVYELVVADSAELRQMHGRRGVMRAPSRPRTRAPASGEPLVVATTTAAGALGSLAAMRSNAPAEGATGSPAVIRSNAAQTVVTSAGSPPDMRSNVAQAVVTSASSPADMRSNAAQAVVTSASSPPDMRSNAAQAVVTRASPAARSSAAPVGDAPAHALPMRSPSATRAPATHAAHPTSNPSVLRRRRAGVNGGVS